MSQNFGGEKGAPMHPNDAAGREDVQEQVDVAVANLQKRMAGEGPSGPPKVPSKKKDDVADPELNDDDPAAEDDSSPTPEESYSSDEDDPQHKDEDADVPVIPERLYRAATHSGWKPEEIVEFWQNDSALAEKTLQRLHDDMVSVNSAYAQQGRANKELQRRAQEVQNLTPEKDPKTSVPKSFIDYDKAEEEFGKGAAEVMRLLDNKLVEVSTQMAEIQASKSTPAKSATAMARDESQVQLQQRVNTFFSADEMNTFNEFYGTSKDKSTGVVLTDWNNLTPTQQANRQKVMILADDMMSGADLRGAEMTMEQALAGAHAIVTKDVTANIARDELRKAIEKRSKGITLRPSSAKVAKKKVKLKPGEKMPQSEVYKRAAQRLSNLAAGQPMQ